MIAKHLFHRNLYLADLYVQFQRTVKTEDASPTFELGGLLFSMFIHNVSIECLTEYVIFQSLCTQEATCHSSLSPKCTYIM
jgi:hypothetical protein